MASPDTPSSPDIPEVAATAPLPADGPAAAPENAAPVWPERLSTAVSAGHAWLMRPRVRISVIGVVLLLIGGLVMTNSVWTLPLVIVGALMVVVAWIGHRLEGRFAVEWGETGTQLAFRATIKAAQPALPAVARAASEPPALAPVPDPGIDEVIEGEAHTVEIDVAELKALIAAAEAGATPGEDVADPVARDIRIRRVVGGIAP